MMQTNKSWSNRQTGSNQKPAFSHWTKPKNMFNTNSIGMYCTRSFVVATYTATAAGHTLLVVFLGSRRDSLLPRTSPFLCLCRRSQAIVSEKTEIDRHSVAAVGCSQFVKAPLRNDKRFWVLPPRDDCRAHMPARNALFSEEAARTRHAQVDNTERKSTTAPLDFEDVHAVLQDVKFPRFFD